MPAGKGIAKTTAGPETITIAVHRDERGQFSAGSGAASTAPSLSGTEKQIEWAAKVRASALDQRPAIERMIEDERQNASDDKNFDADAALLSELMDRAAKEPSASRWIDRRKEGLIGMALESATIPERARVRQFINAYIRQEEL